MRSQNLILKQLANFHLHLYINIDFSNFTNFKINRYIVLARLVQRKFYRMSALVSNPTLVRIK